MSPSWDYDFIKNSPYIALSVIGINVAVIFLIYVAANTKLLRSVRPIADGIQALPTKAPAYVKEKGLLSDLAKDINRTADILQTQRRDLRKKEAARADWISARLFPWSWDMQDSWKRIPSFRMTTGEKHPSSGSRA